MRLINLIKKIIPTRYEIIVTYGDMEYSQCPKTGKRKIKFIYTGINEHGNFIKKYGKNPNRNYLIDCEWLKGENNSPRSPKEIMGPKPIPKR